jgi:hypothetical protein
MKDTYVLLFYIFFIYLIIYLFKRYFGKYKNVSDQNYHNFKSNKNKITPDNFRIRPSILNSNERLFFEQLKTAIGEKYDIYPQVGLSAIFEPINHWNNWGEINKLHKRIDFLLVDKNTQTAKIGIELDGLSHSNPKSFDRDEFVEELFQKFKLRFTRFNNGQYSVEEIRKTLLI